MQADVSDPSDWLNTPLSALSALDSALRCQVCKEFCDTPMITSCSHTFCSLCIRRCLSNDGKCPTCRAEDQSSKLRRNWTVQESVDAFLKSRQLILEVARRPAGGEDNPKRKRRKLEDSSQDSQTGADLALRRSTRSRTKVISSSQDVIALDSQDEGDTEPPPDQTQPPKSAEPDDGLVACPMCNKRMKEETVFSHLDRCDGQQPRKKTPPPPAPDHRSRGLQPSQPHIPGKHLPHLNYSLLKDIALKKKIQELGIPVFGNRQLLIRRHTQWVDIYNANSDSAKPKSNRELLRDLDVWERTQGGHAHTQSGPTGVMRKDFDGGEWTGRHKNQFDDLIAKARAKRAPKPTTDLQAEGKSETMEDVVASSNITPVGEEEKPRSTSNLSKLDTTPDTTSEAASAAIESSPVASMMHSAAQDVRRRSSISSMPIGLSNTIRTYSIPSTSPTPTSTHAMSVSQTPIPNSSQDSRRNSQSLGEKMAGSPVGVKSVPMFQVPEQPVHDIEGFGSGSGGG